MAREDDVQLIHRILSGDDAAFNTLIQRYQKGVHALVWRKVGDFHYAEEITQDTFLKAYKNLPTLRNPNQFAGWLYVIANRLCMNWVQRRKPAMQSLENVSVEEIEESSYIQHISEQRETEAAENRREIVQKLLEKLPESERTVMTLYYLGEMTTREIGRFLGVSANTITSRLQRARKRLQQEEELLVQEVLSGVQVPAHLSQNIMRQVAEMKPTAPPVGKPLLPWMAFGAAAVLVLLMLGMSNRYLVRFQKPYSFEAQSEPTIEIVDTRVVLDIDSKPALRSQVGRVATPSENTGTGLQTSEKVFAPNTRENPIGLSTSQWTQALGPQGSAVLDIFAASKGVLYAVAPTGIYRLPVDAPAWTRIDVNIPIGGRRMPIAAHGDTLYIVSVDEIFASSDDGETWHAFCSRPVGSTVGLIVTNEVQQEGLTMYLALENKGVFRSMDSGGHWDLLNEGLVGKRIRAVTAVGNRVFAGTNDGLYRLNSDVWEQSLKATQSSNRVSADTNSSLYRTNSGVWEQLPAEVFNAVHFLTVTENNLYVGIGLDLLNLVSSGSNISAMGTGGSPAQGWIFRSTDFGESWTEITPGNGSPFFTSFMNIKFAVVGETLLAQGLGLFRSTDAGQTWTNLGIDANLATPESFQSVGVDERNFYTVGTLGVYQTTDAGDSWHLFMNGMVGTRMQNLIAFNDRLYTRTGDDIAYSVDGGESWKSVPVDVSKYASEPVEGERRISFSSDSKLAVRDRGLYWISPEKYNLRIFRLSTDGHVFVPVQGMPTFDGQTLSAELVEAVAEAKQISWPSDRENNAKVTKLLHGRATLAETGGFAVSDGTFYVEHQRRLFKWKPNDLKWTDTGLIDLGEQSNTGLRKELKLAASSETVYVGKRDGKLFQSLDGGDSWKDITPSLPLRFTYFKEIVFAGSTIYVATDKGVLTSQNGEHWRVLSNGTGARIVIDKFATNGMTVYGAGEANVYRFNTGGKLELVSTSVPGKVISLVVSNDRLYIATAHRGMFHISLEEGLKSSF